MLKGTIDKVNAKGYCFIRSENGTEYFCHRSDFLGHWVDLESDVTKGKVNVEFEVAESDKGPRAARVARLDWPNQSS